MTYHHRFRGRAPLIRWTLLDDEGGRIAAGWAVTKELAWQASIAAIPVPSRDELLEMIEPYKRQVQA